MIILTLIKIIRLNNFLGKTQKLEKLKNVISHVLYEILVHMCAYVSWRASMVIWFSENFNTNIHLNKLENYKNSIENRENS